MEAMEARKEGREGEEGLKEKLFKKQEGNCQLCGKMIDFEYLHLNSVHIHHILPIKSGGDKFSLKNLALTHSWCHREHKH